MISRQSGLGCRARLDLEAALPPALAQFARRVVYDLGWVLSLHLRFAGNGLRRLLRGSLARKGLGLAGIRGARFFENRIARLHVLHGRFGKRRPALGEALGWR